MKLHKQRFDLKDNCHLHLEAYKLCKLLFNFNILLTKLLSKPLFDIFYKSSIACLCFLYEILNLLPDIFNDIQTDLDRTDNWHFVADHLPDSKTSGKQFKNDKFKSCHHERQLCKVGVRINTKIKNGLNGQFVRDPGIL